MLKLIQVTFIDETHTYILAKNWENAFEATQILFPDLEIKYTNDADFFPIADCRPPIAENILDLRR